MFGRFGSDRDGNIAIHFAIALVPMIGAMGAAVDYSHANSVKAAMQAALDSTVLMLSRDAATISQSQLETKAANYFKGMFNRPEATNVAVTVAYTYSGGSTVEVNASADVPTNFMTIGGYKTIKVKSKSTAKWGSRRLRVALALDNTGSMDQNGKMAALQSATKTLLTQLKNAANVNGDVYVSIVPFSRDVNANPASYQQSWISWSAWEAANGTCSDNSYRSQGSCTSHSGTWTPAPRSSWNGCITDRGDTSGPSAANYDRTVAPADAGVAASMYPAEQFSSCPVAALGLSYDWTGMNATVDSMTPAGNTNQPIGLVWAWLSLVGGGPFYVPPKDPNYSYDDIIILLTDGLNTQNRWSSSQSAVDRRMYDASNGGIGTCANIKAAGITIYTIQVNTGGDPTQTLLQNCASGPEKFFLLTSADQMVAAFYQIGTAISKLRVAQ